jgi:hypothetical protein
LINENGTQKTLFATVATTLFSQGHAIQPILGAAPISAAGAISGLPNEIRPTANDLFNTTSFRFPRK